SRRRCKKSVNSVAFSAFSGKFDPICANLKLRGLPSRKTSAEDKNDERIASGIAFNIQHDSVHDFQGTYGDYLLSKVSKVVSRARQERAVIGPIRNVCSAIGIVDWSTNLHTE